MCAEGPLNLSGQNWGQQIGAELVLLLFIIWSDPLDQVPYLDKSAKKKKKKGPGYL